MYTTVLYTLKMLLGASLIHFCLLVAADDAQYATIRHSITTAICMSMKSYSKTNQIVGKLKMPSHPSEERNRKLDCKICRDVRLSFCNNCQKFTYVPCYDPHRGQAKSLSAKPTSASATRIFYGRDAYPNELPFQIALLHHNSQWCGGSIYNENWIITAAHCVAAINDSNSHSYSIKAGGISITLVEPNQQIVKLKSIKIHKEYSYSMELQNDIALVQVSPPFKFNIAVAPICLRSLDSLSKSCDDELDDVGAEARASGWGAVENNDTDLPDILRTVQVQVISNEQCQDALISLPHNVTEGNICVLPASSAPGGVCIGDSGGPLFMDKDGERFLIGVVSGGDLADCGGLKSPSFYARITYFYNWIMTNAI